MVSHVTACHSQVCKNVTESCEMKENLDLERTYKTLVSKEAEVYVE